jgi:hypothetical protein
MEFSLENCQQKLVSSQNHLDLWASCLPFPSLRGLFQEKASTIENEKNTVEASRNETYKKERRQNPFLCQGQRAARASKIHKLSSSLWSQRGLRRIGSLLRKVTGQQERHRSCSYEASKSHSDSTPHQLSSYLAHVPTEQIGWAHSVEVAPPRILEPCCKHLLGNACLVVVRVSGRDDVTRV